MVEEERRPVNCHMKGRTTMEKTHHSEEVKHKITVRPLTGRGDRGRDLRLEEHTPIDKEQI